MCVELTGSSGLIETLFSSSSYDDAESDFLVEGSTVGGCGSCGKLSAGVALPT